MRRSIERLAAALLSLVAGAAQAGPLEQQGATLFAQRCAMCHTSAPGGVSAVAPNLAGVVGRPSGAVTGFNYSAALAKGKLRWDPPTLDAFLKAPGQRAPGATMPIGVPSAPDRKALIAHLATLKGS